jgi:hypothetical protein
VIGLGIIWDRRIRRELTIIKVTRRVAQGTGIQRRTTRNSQGSIQKKRIWRKAIGIVNGWGLVQGAGILRRTIGIEISLKIEIGRGTRSGKTGREKEILRRLIIWEKSKEIETCRRSRNIQKSQGITQETRSQRKVIRIEKSPWVTQEESIIRRKISIEKEGGANQETNLNKSKGRRAIRRKRSTIKKKRRVTDEAMILWPP